MQVRLRVLYPSNRTRSPVVWEERSLLCLQLRQMQLFLFSFSLANWRSDDDDDDDGRKFFCGSRTRTIRWCFSWELRRLAWGSENSERVRLSVLFSSTFLLWFWKTWCGAPKCWGGSCSWMTQRCVLQCQVLRLVFQVFCLQICAPSPISRREVKSDNESFVFLGMNICKCSMWKDFFLFYVSQEYFSKSKTIHSTTFTRADFWRDVLLFWNHHFELDF